MHSETSNAPHSDANRGAPSRVESLREIAKSAKYEIGPQIPGDAKSPKSRELSASFIHSFIHSSFAISLERSKTGISPPIST